MLRSNAFRSKHSERVDNRNKGIDSIAGVKNLVRNRNNTVRAVCTCTGQCNYIARQGLEQSSFGMLVFGLITVFDPLNSE
jgi:hypothetical protein